MTIDFNDAKEQRSYELIPPGTLCVVQMNIRRGGEGDDGVLKRSKAGSLMIDALFIVTEGPHAKRRFYGNWVVAGTTEGQRDAAAITNGRIRAILESTHGVKPSDHSDAAKAARCITSYGELDGLRFIVKVGVETGTNGFRDKNVVEEIITPERKEWRAIEQVPPDPTAPAASPAAVATAPAMIERPVWAE